jgi:hypothetical protein
LICKYFRAIRYQNQAIKYFIYFANKNFENLENSWLFRMHRKLTIEPGTILHHSYFIFNEDGVITIWTLEWFVKGCNQLHMSRVHTFDKNLMSWTEEFKAYEKFLNYNGCELKMMLPLKTSNNGLNSYHWGYSIENENVTDGFSVFGITPKIFKIAGEKYNFKDVYLPVMFHERDWIQEFNVFNITGFSSKKGVEYPTVYFDITGLLLHPYRHRTSNVFLNLKYKLYVTPGDLYTSYEKLFLPFDLTTWILLGTTFGVTFLTIFIINQLPKFIGEFFYGSEICTPTLNIIRIFFGVPQIKLPTEIFSRLILIMFIFFCLIFRTCFQSKSFEFLTSEPRRPPPRTLQDLVNQNYTVYTLFMEGIKSVIQNELDQW